MTSDYDLQVGFTELNGGEFRRSDKKDRLVLVKKSRQVMRLHRPKAGGWEVVAAGRFYLAGPMRGYPLSNFPAFFTAARALQARGLEIVSPAEKDIEAGFDFTRPAEEQNFDLHAAFKWDFQAVVDTRGTILLPGWRESKGAAAERLVAELCGKEVYLLTSDYQLVEAPKETYDLKWISTLDRLKAEPVSLPDKIDDALGDDRTSGVS